MLTDLSTSTIGQKPVDTIFFSSYAKNFHKFSIHLQRFIKKHFLSK